ncbi:hypothetical protein [Pseudoalteromonas sp.]|uniref:hypothetical protein n=1 Tax=Pseudoalteromonas TaxID=53246 RepID=UPI003F9A51F4
MKKLYFIALLIITNNAVSQETIVSYERAPWETNEPYMDDEYSKDYAAQVINSDKNQKSKESDCTVKGMTFKERVDCLESVKNGTTNNLPERGSEEYFNKVYAAQSVDLKKSPTKLKRKLNELSELRKKTRMVTAIGKGKVGELTFEQVNSEICLIEKNIGFLSSKKYCIR